MFQAKPAGQLCACKNKPSPCKRHQLSQLFLAISQMVKTQELVG